MSLLLGCLFGTPASSRTGIAPGRDEVAVLGVATEIRGYERAHGDEAQSARTDVLERARHEPSAEAFALELGGHLGVDEDDGPARGEVVDHAGAGAVEQELVEALGRAVPDGYVALFGHETSVAARDTGRFPDTENAS
jgi:hypothetical protein